MIGRLTEYARREEVREQPIRTLLRRGYFEAVQRVAPQHLNKLHRSPLRYTPYLVEAPLTESVGRSLFLYGVYEPLATAVFSSLLVAGDAAIDVGAHYGDFTLVAAAKVGASGTVLAFEPQDEVRSVLERNLQINDIGHVTVLRDALADETGGGRLYTASDALHTGGASLSHIQVGQSERYTTVPIRRLDDVVPEALKPAVRAVKIDVEGTEAAVLRGAPQLLGQAQPAILFEANGVFKDEDRFDSSAFSALRQYGYQLYGMRKDAGKGFIVEPLEPTRNPIEFCEPWLALNLLALMPGSESDRRLRAGGHLR